MPNAPLLNAQNKVLALTSVASFMISLDFQVIGAALNTIRTDLGASMELLEWTLNAYILSFAVLLFAGTAFGDRFGRRRMLITGIAVFAAASAACGLAPNIAWLIAARAVQGAGAALVMPLAMALLSGAFPPAERGKALGIFTGINGGALIAGPVLGGAIAGGFAWQWIFWINVPLGIVLMPLIYRNIGEAFGSKTRLDPGGIALVAGAAFALVWGLTRGNDIGWRSDEVVATLLTASALASLFVAWEARTEQPMLPLRLFRLRAFAAANVASIPYYASIYGTMFLLAQFLQTAQGYGPLGAGLRILPWTATLFFMAPIAGGLIGRVGEKPLVVLGIAMQAAGMAWIALIATPSLSSLQLAVPLMLAGCGGSLAMPALQNAVLSGVPPSDIAKASGAFIMLRFLGGMIGIAVMVATFSATGSASSPQAFTAGFTPAIGVSAVLSLLGTATALLLPGRGASTIAAEAQEA
ncbi:MAG TPA: DHA2 family efflux MFS transporter permease subunit [Stellaceae bacterium]|nr:DHA2 family efflux MFS transporter permease subunit [Stellaceae bacterium]